MRKLCQLLCVCVSFLLFGFLVISGQKRTVQFDLDNNSIAVKIEIGKYTQNINPRSNEDGILYFTMPSFVKDNKIYCNNIDNQAINIDGKDLNRWSTFIWNSDTVYTLEIGDEIYEIAFVKSSILPTFFINTDSGNMDYLDADKNNTEKGYIQVISESGMIEYADSLARISERGNSTFSAWKRSYSISLKNEYSLCGLEAGKKWNLLGMFYEHDKIHSKIIYDMAQKLELEYSPDSTWIELYCNGEYKGLFLLTEAITVGDGRVEIYDLDKDNKKTNTSIDFDTLLPIREENIAYYDIENPVDISGGYLIEKEIPDELKPEEAFFTTKKCNYTFVVRKPKYASKEQVEYIAGFVQKIEDSIVSGTEEYMQYIDVDSFAKQFLIDKIVLEADEMQMSTFFYKEKNKDVLKAGPIWDYDRSMGEIYPSYTTAIEDKPGGMNDWYLTLYKEKEFYQKLIDNYEKLLPYIKELLDYRIDEYADKLTDAVYIDTVIFKQNANDITRSYKEYDSYIRYLKYYLANRSNYLINLWNIPYSLFEVEETDSEMHTVTFLSDNDNVFTEFSILDGECILNLPVLHDPSSFRWRFYNTDKFYDSHIPIYEDTVFIERTADNKSYLEYKIDMIRKEIDLNQYMDQLDDDDFSYVRYDWETDSLLINDNGLKEKLEINLEKESGQKSTTFGLLCYGIDDLGEKYIYIQNQEYNYLSENKQGVFIAAINRNEGSVIDIANFLSGVRIQ